MKRVKLEQIMAGPHGAFPVGKEIDIDDDVADYLVETHQAILVADVADEATPEDQGQADVDQRDVDVTGAGSAGGLESLGTPTEDPPPPKTKKPKTKDV